MRLLRLVVLTCSCSASAVAIGQTWPAKPARIVVGYPAGGVADVMTRVVSTRIAELLGQPMVVDNRPGANANIAIEAVAKASADGYTLLTSGGYLVTNPMLETGLRWQLGELAPVARFTVTASFLVVGASSPAKSLKELVRHAKGNPGLPFADTGPGAPQSLGLAMFESLAGISAVKVSYKGGPLIVPDLVNGTVKVAILPANFALPLLGAGRLIALANTGDKRSPLLPDVPTLAEEGFAAATLVGWQGIHAPAGTPREIIRKISDAIGEAVKNESVKTRIENIGGEVAFLGTPAFQAFLKEDATRWKGFLPVIQKK